MFGAPERSWAGKARLLRLLDDLERSRSCRLTLYLKAGSAEQQRIPRNGLPEGICRESIDEVLGHLGRPDTGAAMFLGPDRALVVVPPFPVEGDLVAEGARFEPLIELLKGDVTVGVVLLRLGRYAVGVLRGDTLVASKTGTRHVKSRHRAGGSSQRRFERSRERLVRELFDKTCETARAVYSPFGDDIDYVLLGGERNTLREFTRRCGYLQGMKSITLSRILNVDRPGKAALDNLSNEVWRSRVLTFAAEGDA